MSGEVVVKARVHVRFKPGVLDPQGQAIGHALKGLGFEGVGDVRQGKLIELDVAASDAAEARDLVEEMCRKLLANPVIETYSVELAPGEQPLAKPGARG